MLSSRKFKWEFWVDPLNRNLDEVAPVKEHGPNTDGGIDYIDLRDTDNHVHARPVDLDYDSNADIPDYEYMLSKVHAVKPIRIAHTKFGLLTVVETAIAGYHFDFWILHSNIEFNQEDLKVLKEIDGVETVNPMTRYRMKIGFPKSGLFDVSSVKIEIEKSLKERYELAKTEETNIIPFEKSFSDEIVIKVNDKISELKGKSGHWLLYVLPNGKMEVYESDFLGKSYQDKHQLYSQSQKLLGGHIFNS